MGKKDKVDAKVDTKVDAKVDTKVDAKVDTPENKNSKAVAPEAEVKPRKEARSDSKMQEEKGTLMLRFFKKDDRTGKILTRLRRKVFFPVDPFLEPGWYIATIIETHDTHGVMDVMNLDQVPIHLWKPQIIKGVYIERDHSKNCLRIFPAIPAELLAEQEPVCVYTVQLPEPKYHKGTTIAEIMEEKAKMNGMV